MKNVVIYSRTASHKQANDSRKMKIEMARLYDYCKMSKFAIKGIYYDMKSEMPLNRDGFKAMINDLQSGAVKADYLLVSSPGQISRSLNEAIKLIERLKSIGLTIIYTDQNLKINKDGDYYDISLTITKCKP